MKTLGILVAGVLIGVGAGLAVIWLVWMLWCLVLPQIWANGPAAIVRPSYVLFGAAWVLIGFIGLQIFPRRSED